jgi:hypothetical protein
MLHQFVAYFVSYCAAYSDAAFFYPIVCAAVCILNLLLAIIVATRPEKPSGFFSISPVARGILTFFFGLPVLLAAVGLWPITLVIWLRSRHINRQGVRSLNDQMIMQWIEAEAERAQLQHSGRP